VRFNDRGRWTRTPEILPFLPRAWQQSKVPPPKRRQALNHAFDGNKLAGCTKRVAMTNRSTHDPTPESNEQIYAFFEHFLRPDPTMRSD
jgi:hypothetical protein